MLTHIDKNGTAKQVDISKKHETIREAIASVEVILQKETIKAIQKHTIPKGDVLTVARIAGIMAAKHTPSLIPLCHPIPLEHADIEIEFKPPDRLIITARTRTTYKTGVEMEAMTAAAVSALTVYDMCKSMDKSAEITNLCLLSKKGGKSRIYKRNEK